MPTSPYPAIRRVVTGHDKAGKAKVLIDGPATNAKFPGPGAVSTLMWITDAMPCDMAVGEDAEDMGARIVGTPPPENGTRFAILEVPPGNAPVMHRTESIDYVIVLAGEIEMDMDAETVKLKAGDVLIQRGTHHAWANRSSAPAKIAVVLIDAKPLGLGHAVSRAESARA